jgi:hypothetical protein
MEFFVTLRIINFLKKCWKHVKLIYLFLYFFYLVREKMNYEMYLNPCFLSSVILTPSLCLVNLTNVHLFIKHEVSISKLYNSKYNYLRTVCLYK